MAEELGITRIEKHGEAYVVEGAQRGEKASFVVPAKAFEETARAEGEKGLRETLKRQAATNFEWLRSQR